jgi:hypothetical protein
MKKFLFCLFTLLIFSNAFADQGEVVKDKLQKYLLTEYLPFLETKFGACPTGQTCLNQQSDYMRAALPKKNICFPYTTCGFYHCMEEQYQCESVGVNYFTKLAFPTCSQYVSNINKGLFTQKGVEWIYTVMVCLQKGLSDECAVNGNCPESNEPRIQKKTCDHITDFTLAYHPGCYINSGVGVCKLPLKDKQAIWKTVSPYLTDRERQEAYKVIFNCLKPGHLASISR